MSARTDDPAKILLVDDTPANLTVLRDALETEGHDIAVATSGSAALRIVASVQPDLILLDVVMPEPDGYETCRRLQAEDDTRDIPVIFITAQHEKENLLEGFRVGGVDYVTKPFDLEEVLVRVRTHLQIRRLTRELQSQNEQLRLEIERRERAEAETQEAREHLDRVSRREAERWGIEGFIGTSPAVEQILQDVRQLQESPASTSVLICGESGTGKELIARALHFGGQRRHGPFVPVNCAAIPAELTESMLFGHVKGAFTGAVDDRDGFFVQAHGGTLFLDEIGDMPLELQAKLLRVLEEGRVTPVGGQGERAVDVRVVAATNTDVAAASAQNRFRQDLYFRLAQFTLLVPPLRERTEDIPVMIQRFVQALSSDMGLSPPAVSVEALGLLQAYAFPGNVRELKNLLEHALIRSGGGTIAADHLAFLPVPAPPADEAAPPVAQLPPDEEDRVVAYVRQRGSITNRECRQLLQVDRRRATYLLDKLVSARRLTREGQHRHTTYHLPT